MGSFFLECLGFVGLGDHVTPCAFAFLGRRPFLSMLCSFPCSKKASKQKAQQFAIALQVDRYVVRHLPLSARRVWACDVI